MDFYFPRSRIFLTAVHKSGSTSAMNFFGALEQYLDMSNLSIDQHSNEAEVELNYLDKWWEVHSDNEIALKYIVESNFLSDGIAICSIAIVRDPLERFSSFWFNKIALVRDSTYFEVAKKYFPNVEITSMESIRESAKAFLKSTEFTKRLLDDLHLRPQAASIQLNRKYDLVIETKQLSQIPQRLADKSSQFRFISESKFPHFNITEKELTDKFYDEELVNMLVNAYSEDFNLLESKNISLTHHNPHYGGEPEAGLLDKINAIRIRELANQMMARLEFISRETTAIAVERDAIAAERDAIAAERDAMLNSRIWRFTRFYRESKLLNRKKR